MDDAERRDLQMAADDDLRRYRDAQREIDDFRETLLRKRAKTEALTRWFNPDTCGVHGDSKPLDELMTIIHDMEREYLQRQIGAEYLCMELEYHISKWTQGIEESVLRRYYLFNHRLEKIAADKDYSYSQIKRIRWKALENYGIELKKYQNKY